ncbi:MAG TPA: hypothetical protein VK166_15815 [Chitinophagaceae bacterium]|nr:hypothetical protein [Chitinophagaceae bacterium]
MRYRWSIALFLLFIYIQPARAVRELFKLPLLVEHYFDHQEESNKMNLVSFLVSHYYTEDGTDYDANEDSKLPFKSSEQITAGASIAVSPPVSSDILTRPDLSPLRNYLIMDDENIPSDHLDAIWQPPRHC